MPLTESGWAVTYSTHAQVTGGYLSIRPFVSTTVTHHQPSISLSSPRASRTMSAVPSTSTSRSNFASIFNSALDKYKRKTKQDLAKHPLLPRLQSCDSPEDILAVLRLQIPEFDQSQNGGDDDGLTTWVTPTVNVLYSFSATIGGAVGLVNISIFPYDNYFPSNIQLLGIPSGEHNIYGVWRSSHGSCLPPPPFHDLF